MGKGGLTGIREATGKGEATGIREATGKGEATGNGLLNDAEVVAEEIGHIGDDPRMRIALAAIALAIALLSFFVLAGIASSPDSYADTIQALDEKKTAVMGLVAGSTAASAAVSLIPGDAGTPIAEKLVDLSSDFLIVITAIYLEKYLLTTLGFAAFKVLIPLACVLFAVALFISRKKPVRGALERLAAKLVLFGLAIVCVVPVSVGVSGMIESTYEDSVNETLALAEQTTESIEGAVEEETASESPESPLEWIANLPSNVSSSASDALAGLTADAQKALNDFMDALAMMIVTSCVIPILVLVFFLWLVKIILGVDVSTPVHMLRPRTFGRGMR